MLETSSTFKALCTPPPAFVPAATVGEIVCCLVRLIHAIPYKRDRLPEYFLPFSSSLKVDLWSTYHELAREHLIVPEFTAEALIGRPMTAAATRHFKRSLQNLLAKSIVHCQHELLTILRKIPSHARLRVQTDIHAILTAFAPTFLEYCASRVADEREPQKFAVYNQQDKLNDPTPKYTMPNVITITGLSRSAIMRRLKKEHGQFKLDRPHINPVSGNEGYDSFIVTESEVWKKYQDEKAATPAPKRRAY